MRQKERSRQGRPRGWARRVVYAAYIINALAIVGFWWASSGFESTRSWSDFFNGAGRVSGLLGTYMVLWQLVLLSRTGWLEKAWGLEKEVVLHKWNGYGALLLLLVHAGTQTVGYELGDGMSVMSQLGAFVGNYPGVLAAMVALGLMAVVVVMSVGMARRRMKYETWYFIHLYAYMGVVLAFSHQLATGVDFAGNPAFVGYWIALYGITAWILLWSRLGGVLRKHQKHALKVAGVTKEAKGVFSIYISGRNLQDLKAEAGQAAWWRFMDSKRWWQAHPFSISDRTDGKRLRITVKNIGDFTREIHNLKVGTPVLMEGPFGKFIERGEGEKVLLVAGGIGITPLRALAEEMLEEGLDVHLIYRVHSEGDIVFKQELEALKAKGLKIDYSLGTGTKKTSREAWVRPESLAKWVEDVAEREAWVCGPKEMTEAVVESLLEAGVKRGQIQTEVFRLQ